MSVITNTHGEVVAVIAGTVKAGPCRYGFASAKEALDANREQSLVSARDGFVSNAKRYERAASIVELMGKPVDASAPRDFLIA